MVPWRFRIIADKLAKMIGGRGADDGDDDFSLPFDHPIACRSNSVDVPHMRQRFDWDCGLACVLMVLRTVGLEQFDIRDLEKICGTTSIWTVDLAYLLHKFSVKFSFLTVTLGANPEYSAESYYREQLQDDIERVDGLFEKALEAGINIQCRSISAKDISLLILTGQCVAVALVNKIKLSQYWTKDSQDADCYMSNSDYMGHYVVICGFDGGSGEFEIRDPASPRKHEKLSIECLDEARKSFGTDEDILLNEFSRFTLEVKSNYGRTILKLDLIRFKVFTCLVHSIRLFYLASLCCYN
ncbi:guanylyl cyclase 1 isoform X1 [Curcuma longa]|uniref:guanylyl cyclase 1 isoform X1 n=1 Tax=Curcuma longa TaxID=136217 RepID=UPI003D9E9FED